jgi:hypothetical protein
VFKYIAVQADAEAHFRKYDEQVHAQARGGEIGTQTRDECSVPFVHNEQRAVFSGSRRA